MFGLKIQSVDEANLLICCRTNDKEPYLRTIGNHGLTQFLLNANEQLTTKVKCLIYFLCCINISSNLQFSFS